MNEAPKFTFVDPAKRRWSLQISVGKRNRLLELLGVDVDRVVEDGLKPLAVLTEDLEKFGTALWILVEDQANGLDPKAWYETFLPQTLYDAREALKEAVIDFFRNPRQQDALRGVLEKNDLIIRRATDLAVASVDVESAAQMLAGSYGNAPGSSA